MSSETPCLPECRCKCGDLKMWHGVVGRPCPDFRAAWHPIACPNATPAPPQEPPDCGCHGPCGRADCCERCAEPEDAAPPQDAEPVEEAIQIAAQCWCDSETSDRVMDSALATAFAKRLSPYLALRDRLAAAEAGLKREAYERYLQEFDTSARQSLRDALAVAEKRVEELTRDYVDSCACPQCPTEAEKRREKDKTNAR